MTVDPGKNFEGQRGFPTPDSTPDITACRVFRVPDNDDWLGILMGAVEVLMQEYNWYNWGSISIPDTVAAWSNIIQAAYDESLTGTCPITTVDAPYWDDSDDVDDESEIADQTWYGEVDDPTVAPSELTFRENAEIWTFAGLIALAAGPGAAVSFLTIAPRFVVAFKQANIGKIIRVFVDASQVGQITDDGSGDVVEMSVAGDPALDSHQLYITTGDS